MRDCWVIRVKGGWEKGGGWRRGGMEKEAGERVEGDGGEREVHGGS